MPFILPDPDPTPSPLEINSVVDFYGVDIRFEDGESPIVNVSGDYDTVSGTDALKQAILIRLITVPGEYAARPDFGCGVPQWLKKRMSQSDLDSLRQTILDQLTQETRITKVDSVSVTPLPNTAGVQIKVQVTALGRSLPMAFSFSE